MFLNKNKEHYLVKFMSQKLEIKDFFSFWRKVQESILHMASLLTPEDLAFTCDPKLSSVGETFYHLSQAYNGWLTYQIIDGEKFPDQIPVEQLTVENITESVKAAFARCQRLLDKLTLDEWNKQLTDYDEENRPYNVSLNWVLWHLVEHDFHHRAQLKLQFSHLNKEIDSKIFWESP